MSEPEVVVKGKSFYLGDYVTVRCIGDEVITGMLCSWCDAFNGCTEEDTYDIKVDDGPCYCLSPSEIVSIEKVSL